MKLWCVMGCGDASGQICGVAIKEESWSVVLVNVIEDFYSDSPAR